MLAKKWLLAGILTLLSLSLALAAPPAVHPTTGAPLVITCLRGAPDAIDGDLSDWSLDTMTPAVLDATAQMNTGQANWTGPADCSGKFYLLWDDTKIYIAAIVKDDKLSMTKTDGNIWNADCLEVFFSTTNAVAGHAEHYQFGFNANGQKWNWESMGGAAGVAPDYLKVASTRTADGYICEVSIEYGRMTSLSFAEGTTIGFHAVIDDTEATDREIQMTWTGREAHDQSLGFGHVILSSDPALPKELSRVPSPARGAVDVPMDVILSWNPGKYAVSHDVYLGTALDAVDNATRDKPLGVLVGRGQATVEFDPASLAYGTTYYWRVDEVNAPPSSTIYKGYIWSFTTEPYAYTLPGVTVTASSASPDMGAAKTVDGSGLDAGGLHSSVDVDGWLTDPASELPAWIRYDLGRACTIQQMKVWNSNQQIEFIVGFGAKSVLIEYSLDGATWTTLKTEEFPQAFGADGYAGFTVDMSGVQARYVRLTIQTNWSPYFQQTGLSEVQFSCIPMQAFAPQPAAAATGVSVDASLNWRPGRQAGSHKVFFGTDQAAVAGGTVAAKTVTEHSYVPNGLNFGTTYYWRVDEVNTVTYPGDVWSFSTLEYLVVDDFESYANDSPKRLFQTWIDGAGFSPDEFFSNGDPGNGTGSLVGYDPTTGDIVETKSVHGGRQAMPIEYNNVNSPYYSEVSRTFDATQNWTANGATDLSLWFRGNPGAFVETASGATLSGAGADIYMATAEFRYAYKKLSGDGSITVRLDSAQTAASWTKCGVMIRESLVGPLPMQVHMISAPQQSLVEWMYRSATNSATTTQFNTAANTNPLPVWLRLTRAGNVFTGECSVDGKTWTKIAASDATPSSTTINMPASVYIGMIVCSQSAGNLAVANFSQIKTTGNVTGQWQAADVGVAQPANKPDQLYVVIQDSANRSVTVKHPGGVNAVLTDQWTQWKIPLSQLTGVNTKAIKKMIIGVGDRANPKASGAGMLFIDDIGYGHPLSSE